MCFADPSAVPASRVVEAEAEVRRRDALPYVAEAFRQSLRALLATYLDASPGRPWRLAERIAAPTLLVYGNQDKLVDPIAAHTTAFPDRRVLLLLHCGHVAQLEAPVLVSEAWRELLPHPRRRRPEPPVRGPGLWRHSPQGRGRARSWAPRHQGSDVCPTGQRNGLDRSTVCLRG